MISYLGLPIEVRIPLWMAGLEKLKIYVHAFCVCKGLFTYMLCTLLFHFLQNCIDAGQHTISVVFMNAQNLHFIFQKLQYIMSNLLLYSVSVQSLISKKISVQSDCGQQVCTVSVLHNVFHQFVNNLYYRLKCFVNTKILYSYIDNKSKVNSLSMCDENRAVSG